MKLRSLIILLFLILAAGTAACIMIIGGYRHEIADPLKYNDIQMTVRKNIDHLNALDDAYPDSPVIVFDANGFLAYPENSPVKDISSAIREGYVLLPVSDGNRFLATAAIPDPDSRSYDNAEKRLMAAAVIMVILFGITSVIFILYTNKNVIKPFGKMQDFAGRIAMGDLDTPLSMDKGNLFGIFTESFDIMREELKSARERENALKLKEKELVAQLSHDLKTPIAGINTICDVLSVKVTDDYTLGKVHDIQKKTAQMDMLVTDLFTTALDDLGEMTVNCTDENSHILGDIIQANDPRSLTVSESIPECLINIDKIRMSQIVGNIIGNSYKYADTSIDVTYTLSGDYLKMAITDHGAGVPEDELTLITNKFYRGKSVRSSDKGGSGLGLYIASELMAKMNGELICSCSDKGFTVTLMILLS
ncbi:MAG: HAMP domain-containing histidine kinase [Oscillospiraceae bacterium]|nr:HAMP domain-containing histidine kinase [Oscillospiraceae bacterium]